MSVMVVAKLSGDTNAFRKSLEEDADAIRKLGERAREVGALHHRFAVGDGFILVIDEWESLEAYESFMASPELAALIGSVFGGTPPEITVGEAVDSPDMF